MISSELTKTHNATIIQGSETQLIFSQIFFFLVGGGGGRGLENQNLVRGKKTPTIYEQDVKMSTRKRQKNLKNYTKTQIYTGLVLQQGQRINRIRMVCSLSSKGAICHDLGRKISPYGLASTIDIDGILVPRNKLNVPEWPSHF